MVGPSLEDRSVTQDPGHPTEPLATDEPVEPRVCRFTPPEPPGRAARFYAVVRELILWAPVVVASAAVYQARISTTALEVAQRNSEGTLRAAESGGRAWLIPTIDDVGVTIDRPATPVTVAVLNYGASPAFNMRARVDWAFSVDALPKVAPPRGGAIVPPNKVPPMGLPLVIGVRVDGNGIPILDGLTAADRSDIAAGRKTVYVGAFIEYDDAFGRGRSTRWCAEYIPLGTDFASCLEPGTNDVR